MSELVFLLSADADIQTAYEFHEAVQSGRGEVFMRHLDVAFGQIRNFPSIAPPFHESYRRLLIHGFPYGIFYSLEGGRIIVSGVMDLRQDPGGHTPKAWRTERLIMRGGEYAPAAVRHPPASDRVRLLKRRFRKPVFYA